MPSNEDLLEAAVKLTELAREHSENLESRELADIIVKHSCSVAEGMIVALIQPGTIPVWMSLHMYVANAALPMFGKISSYMHLQLNIDMLRSVSAEILLNISRRCVSPVSLFKPIGGFYIHAFSTMYVSGLMFLEALINILKTGNDPSHLTTVQMKEELQKAAESVDAREAYEEAIHAVMRHMNQRGKDVDTEE